MNRQMVKIDDPQIVKASPKVIEIHSPVQRPIRLNAILVSLLVLLLALLAMVPVRDSTMFLSSGKFYERPLIVWVVDQVRENVFIWDPTQVR